MRPVPAYRNSPGPSCTGRTPGPVPGMPAHKPVPHTSGLGKQPPRAAVANCSNHSRHCQHKEQEPRQPMSNASWLCLLTREANPSHPLRPPPPSSSLLALAARTTRTGHSPHNPTRRQMMCKRNRCFFATIPARWLRLQRLQRLRHPAHVEPISFAHLALGPRPSTLDRRPSMPRPSRELLSRERFQPQRVELVLCQHVPRGRR